MKAKLEILNLLILTIFLQTEYTREIQVHPVQVVFS